MGTPANLRGFHGFIQSFQANPRRVSRFVQGLSPYKFLPDQHLPFEAIDTEKASSSRIRDITECNNWPTQHICKTQSFQPHYCPGIDSASNRNEYRKSSWGVKGDRHVRLKNSPPSVSRLSGKCGSLDVSQSNEASQPVTGIFLPLRVGIATGHGLDDRGTRVRIR
jgi:hypothetical protein